MNDHVRQVQPRPQPDPKQKPTVRTHKRAFLLLAFYIPLVVIPWVVTLILVYRPMAKSSWTYGPGFSYKDYKVMQGWAKAIPIMNVFAAIFAITVTSSVIAQVAVLFAQRRHAGQQMSVRRLFALADRVWCDWAALPRTLMDGEKSSNWIFLLGAITVFLGAIQHPLVQILVPWEDVRIPNCASTRFITERDYGVLRCDALSREPFLAFQSIGIDLEPAQMAIISASSIIPRISSDLSLYMRGSDIPYMWQAKDKYGASIPTNLDNADQQVWIAALPADTTTGVLREHIMRLNSSVSCTNLTASAFPSTCTGTNPFRASFNYVSWENRWNGTLEVCAPGDQGTYPWTLSRNRQEITEELFIRYAETYVSESFGDDSRDGVMHCTAQTSRGYFELGNFYNGGQAGPLLDKWPSREVPYQYHDYFEQELTATSDRRPPYIPSEVDDFVGSAVRVSDPRENIEDPPTYTYMAGPLMTSALTIFGPLSWAESVRNLTINKSTDELAASHTDQAALLSPFCDRTPFVRLRPTNSAHYYCPSNLLGLRQSLDSLLSAFANPQTTTSRITAAVLLANQAALTSHTAGVLPWPADTGRTLYTAEGWTARRPAPSLATQIVLSLILALHVAALLYFAVCLYRRPGWTRTLDALAVARIAATLDPAVLPPLRCERARDTDALAHIDGVVGVVSVADAHSRQSEAARRPSTQAPGAFYGDDIAMETLSVASTAGKEPGTAVVAAEAVVDDGMVLGLGAPGVVRRLPPVPVVPRTAPVPLPVRREDV